MSGTTSVPRPTFGPNGFILPTEADILAGVLADINAAFGGNLNPSLETPQGQLASSTAAIIGDCNDQFLALTQGVDPAYAQGRMQDGIARIYFITRNPALPTSVAALCAGLPGVVIPAGATAQAQDGNLYTTAAGGVIGLDGTATVTFACNVTGPIPCPIGALDTIYQTVAGWDSVTNLADGVLGNDVETRAAFEYRRQQTVAQNSVGVLPAILGAVLGVADVLDAYVTENATGAPITLDGVSVPAHSLYVCVAGGEAQAVARAIWSKKPPGCGYSGGTTETVLDENAGYSLPFPSYAVSFQTAQPQAFVVEIDIAASALVPANALAQIQPAVLAAFAGADGGSRARINSTVYASRYYAGIQALGAWAEIVSIKLGSSVAPTASFTASIAGTVLTVTAVAAGALAVGDTVQGASLADGCLITALGTGTGGIGTYTVSLSQTVASEAMTAIGADLDAITVGAAHVPVLAAANVVVNLV